MSYTNQLTQRHKLHRRLIEMENRSCSMPNCKTPYDRREIHRIIPGGDYTMNNVKVRCFNCHHFIDHPASKFRIGDTIVLNGRTPAYIDLARHKPRTIIAIRYDSKKQCNFYLVGSNCKGVNSGNGNPLEGYTTYLFRSYMLHRPRPYHYHRKYIRSACDTQESLLNGKANTTALRDTQNLTLMRVR